MFAMGGCLLGCTECHPTQVGVCPSILHFAFKSVYIVLMDGFFEVDFEFWAEKCENSFEKRLYIDKKLSEICKMHKVMR